MAIARRKPKSTRRVLESVWSDEEQWTVKFGKLLRSQGRPSKTQPLFTTRLTLPTPVPDSSPCITVKWETELP